MFVLVKTLANISQALLACLVVCQIAALQGEAASKLSEDSPSCGSCQVAVKQRLQKRYVGTHAIDCTTPCCAVAVEEIALAENY